MLAFASVQKKESENKLKRNQTQTCPEFGAFTKQALIKVTEVRSQPAADFSASIHPTQATLAMDQENHH